MDLRKSRKYRRKKWVTASLLTAVSVGFFATNNKVNADSVESNFNSDKVTDTEKKAPVTQNIDNHSNIKQSCEVTQNINNKVSDQDSNSLTIKSQNVKNISQTEITNSKIAQRKRQDEMTAIISIYVEPNQNGLVKQKDGIYKYDGLTKVKSANGQIVGYGKRNTTTGKYEVAEKNGSAGVYVTHANDGSFDINLPKGYENYEFDKAFADQWDTKRNSIFEYESPTQVKFNFNNLPTDGSLDGNRKLDASGNPSDEAYQLWIKPKKQKTYQLQTVNQHTNEGLINWFDNDTGDYIGTTVVDDYSMGLGTREIIRAENDDLSITGDSAKANVERTVYTIAIPEGYTIAIGGDLNSDGTYGPNGYIPLGSNNRSVIWDFDLHNREVNGWKANPQNSNKIGKYFAVRAYLINNKGASNTDIPPIVNSTGYTSEDKIPFFVEYIDDNNNYKRVAIASFTGKLGNEYNVAENLKNSDGIKFSGIVHISNNWNNEYKLPSGYIFSKYNFDNPYRDSKGNIIKSEEEKWVQKYRFQINDPHYYLVDNDNNLLDANGTVSVHVVKENNNVYRFVPYDPDKKYDVSESVYLENHPNPIYVKNLDFDDSTGWNDTNKYFLIDANSKNSSGKGSIKSSLWDTRLVYYFDINYPQYKLPEGYKIKYIKDITNDQYLSSDIDLNKVSYLDENKQPRSIKIVLTPITSAEKTYNKVKNEAETLLDSLDNNKYKDNKNVIDAANRLKNVLNSITPTDDIEYSKLAESIDTNIQLLNNAINVAKKADQVQRTGLKKCKDGYYRFYNSDGTLVVSQYKEVNGKWYYFDNQGRALNNGMVKLDDGYTHYFNEDGTQAMNTFKTVNGQKYYFDNNGHMVNNGIKKAGDNYYYFNADGSYAVSKFKESNGYWYYFDNNGHMLNGGLIKLSDGYIHYFNADGTQAMNKFRESNGKWYYFDNNGHMVNNG